jgi:toxin HigB-1
VSVIKTFRSKALKAFANEGDPSGLPVANHDRVRRILERLAASTCPQDMALAGFRFHPLRGKPKRYSVDASGNYRVTFGWSDGDAIDVDIEDYH